MDFAAIMAGQISKAKTTKKPATEAGSADGSKNKYIRKSDAESAREAAYLADQAAKKADRAARAELKRKAEDAEEDQKREKEEWKRQMIERTRRARQERDAEEERERRARLGLPDLVKPEVGTDGQMSEEAVADGQSDPDGVPDERDDPVVRARLRAFGRDESRAGESDGDRLSRYFAAARLARRQSNPVNRADGPIPTSLHPIAQAEMKVDCQLPAPNDDVGRERLGRQLTSYFNLVMHEWQIALDDRSEDTKESFQGRAAFKAMQQAAEGLTPLFKKLDTAALEDSLLEPIVEIVTESQARRYVAANDAYLRLSIGKAAWPIGVTMVGIHERSAREKLHQSDKEQAHIMSDETTRKSLQSIKRCLTFAQTRWPPHDQLQLMG